MRTFFLVVCVAAFSLPPLSSAQQESSSSSSSSTTMASVNITGSRPVLTLSEKKLIAQGYKLVTKDDLKIFCRQETPLGTRFAHQVCRTEAQIESLKKTSQDAFDAGHRIYMGPQAH